jgi:hypothetical protein
VTSQSILLSLHPAAAKARVLEQLAYPGRSAQERPGSASRTVAATLALIALVAVLVAALV